MQEFIATVPEFVIYGLLGLIMIFSYGLGWLMKSIVAGYGYKKRYNLLRDEQEVLQRNMKKLWDQELHGVQDEKHALEAKLLLMETRLENYRTKIAGLGVLNLWGSKKRSDILYSLLLENEALEALLNAQTKRMAQTHQEHLEQRLLDIGKRQRLMAEIFNDQRIKDYVRDVIAEKQDVFLVPKTTYSATKRKARAKPKNRS
ncbi:hypothetical protein COTS27_01121 [Spirochaetota bacterium]|nr:hypothetical protein COTS27_01121 [Spirochaetota bacterium]